MNRRVRYIVSTLAAAVAAVSLAAAVAYAAEPQAAAKVAGKKAAFTLNSTTKFGGFTLKPGRYEFQHRMSGSEHLMYFTDPRGRPVSPGGVQCTLETRAAKVPQTALTTVDDDGVRRITGIQIAGEKVTHVFQDQSDGVNWEELLMVPILAPPDQN